MSADTTPDDAIDLYWRPGCPFCMILTRGLRRHGVPMRMHNIWDDPDAAALVRGVARGNETVPTVRIGDRYLVNPSTGAVLDAIASGAPEIVATPPAPARPRRRWPRSASPVDATG